MTTTGKVVLGAVVVLGLGYLGMKYYYPPTLTIYSINPLDGSGTFQWGKMSGSIGPGGGNAGWGWSGTWANFVPGTGWSFMVTKNGTLYKTVTVSTVGDINI